MSNKERNEELRALVSDAILRYGSYNNEDPVWFPYSKLEGTYIQKYPPFSTVLGITDENLKKLVHKRSFGTFRDPFFLNQFDIRTTMIMNTRNFSTYFGLNYSL